jgi:LPXTG-site transpeptidase (sortase) family protein
MDRDNKHEEPEQQKRRRRRWVRWVGTALILAGVLVALYPLGTEIYGWLAQRELRAQLTRADPAVVTPTPAAVEEAQAPAPSTTSLNERSPAGPVSTTELVTRQDPLDELRTASKAYQASVAGKSGTPIGRLVIPSIGMDLVMIEGTGTGDLKQGPGHWPETPFPGQLGNFVVSGHRTTYGAPFFKLNKIKVGDEIELILPYATVRYSVTRVVVVLPTEVDTVAQLGREQVSLAACHPSTARATG